METLSLDHMAKMKSHKDQSQTILDVLGADLDSKFTNSVMLYQTSAVDSISIGGLSNVAPGSTVQISIRDQNILLYLQRTCVCFDLNVTRTADNATFSAFDNAVSLFQLMNIQLGSISGGIGNGQFLLQHHLKNQKDSFRKKYQRGIVQRNHAVGSNIVSAIGAGGTFAGSISSSESTAARRLLQLQMSSLETLRHQLAHIKSDTDGTEQVIQCAIPLSLLLPQFAELPDQVLFLGLGQQLVANFRLSNALDCMTGLGAAPNYSISNAFLVKCYTELDQQAVSKILGTSVPIPRINIISVPRPAAQQQSFVWNLPKNERLRKITLSMNPTVGIVNGAVNGGGDILQNIYTTGTSRWWKPISYSPMFNLQQLQISVNGRQQSLNMQTLSTLMSSDVFGYIQGESSGDPWLDFSRYVLQIDLSRFGLDEDCYGSGEETNLIQMEIQISTTLPSLYFGQTISAAQLATFTFQSFIYTIKDCSLENGIYKA